VRACDRSACDVSPPRRPRAHDGLRLRAQLTSKLLLGSYLLAYVLSKVSFEEAVALVESRQRNASDDGILLNRGEYCVPPPPPAL